MGACPLGSLQNALASSNTRTPVYILGILALFGVLLGRTICGFLCPFGLVQDLLHKIPTPKLKKNRVTRVLSYFKYVLLVVLVVLVPLAYMLRDLPVPGFCKYICPAGTLGGAISLLLHPDNNELFGMLGPLFTWKFALPVSFLVSCVFIYRTFCRFFCPLGAIHGFFNKIALLGVKCVEEKCTHCGLCVSHCKMDIRHVGDHECIQCGACMDVCPTKAIEWKGSKIFLKDNEGGAPAKPRKGLKYGLRAAAVIVLAAALIFFNVVQKPVEATQTVSGDPAPDFTVESFTGDTYTLSDHVGENGDGKAVILNFWFVSCTPLCGGTASLQPVRPGLRRPGDGDRRGLHRRSGGGAGVPSNQGLAGHRHDLRPHPGTVPWAAHQ